MNVGSIVLSLATLSIVSSASACIWDSDSLSEEKAKSPKLAKVILGSTAAAPDPAPLQARIARLKAHRNENDPAWWNDLAGAYLRLGRPSDAAQLLEPVVGKFPDDYGIHANLGTAYHLLGRYKDAERKIARDLEINPEGHFGLEKYHLALLQYLVRDDAYKIKHVYLDEFTPAFFAEWNYLDLMLYEPEEGPTTPAPDRPAYRLKWNLAADPKLADGAIYMASLNPKEPACFVGLGIICLRGDEFSRDLHLAAAAFDKAIQLGSPQKEVLVGRIGQIRGHIRLGAEHTVTTSPRSLTGMTITLVVGVVGVAVLAGWLVWRRRLARAHE